MARKYELTEAQAALVHQVVASHCQALKNWTASRVEHGKFDDAQELVKELRKYEQLFALTNVEAHRSLDRTNV
jgi:hypothetical protein